MHIRCLMFRYDEEDEHDDLGLLLARQAHKQKRLAQDGPDESQDSVELASSAPSTHKRKSIPIKSLPAAKHTPQWHNHAGQMKMLQEQVVPMLASCTQSRSVEG